MTEVDRIFEDLQRTDPLGRALKAMSKHPVQHTEWYAPKGMTAGDIGTHFVVLRWEDPGEDNRLEIVNFEVHEVIAKDADQPSLFMIGDELNDGLTSNHEKARATVRGDINAAGCVHFEGLDGHYCTSDSLFRRLKAVRLAYDVARSSRH